MPIRKAQWKTDTQFNFGTPTKTNVEVVGSGDSAYLSLAQQPDNSDNITFVNPSDFTFDPTKIEVTGGVAKLLASIAGDYNWPFTVSGDYTFNPTKVLVSGGVASLVGSSPLAPYAWWHLNESSGTNAADSSGNGRNGTLVNMESGDWIAGKLNNCLQFDGVNEYINVGNVFNRERNQPFSIEFWFKTSAGGYMAPITKFNVAGGKGQNHLFDAGKLVFYLSADGTYRIRVHTNSTYNDGTWHHCIMTYSGSSTASGVKIYVDGSLAAVTIDFDTLTTGTCVNSDNLTIARRSDGYYYNGQLDEIVLYDFELTAGDVTSRWNGGAGTEIMPGAYSMDNPTIYPTTLSYVFSTALSVFTETATKPSGSNLKYQVSSDNGITWKWWNGAIWIAITGGQTDTWYYNNESNLASIVNTNISTLAISGTFKFRAFLHSDTGAATPSLDNIYIAESIAYPIGDWPIIMNNDIDPTYITAWLTFVETVTKPVNTNILYQCSEDSGGTWNGSWLTAAQMQTAIQGIGSPDKLKIKIQLSTTDNMVTPEIDNILITSDAGYYTNGSYESYAYQPENNTNGVYLQDITITKTVPGGTSLTVEVRHVNHTLETGYVEYNDGDSIELCGDIIQWKATFIGVGAVSPQLDLIEISFHTLIGIMQAIDNNMDIVKKIETNRWKIDSSTNQMIFYDDDGITPLYVFNLKDKNGLSASTNVFERVPV